MNLPLNSTFISAKRRNIIMMFFRQVFVNYFNFALHWLAFAILATSTTLLGTIGYIVYYDNNIDGNAQTEAKPTFVSTIGKNDGQLSGEIGEKKKFSVATCFYKSLQLFYLNAGAEPEKMNLSLEISRFTGALFSFNMILAGGIGLFRSYANRLLIRFYENHHIVFGYGGPGREIVVGLAAKGEFAIVIADALSEEEREHLDHLGIPWFKRKPMECVKDIENCLALKNKKYDFITDIINQLGLKMNKTDANKDMVNCFNNASAKTASSFYLVFDNENINLILMHKIRELYDSREFEIYCRSQVPLEFAEFCGESKSTVPCNRLDPSLSAVRRHLVKYPIDIYRSQSIPPSGTRSRILIIGWHDTISRPLLLQSVLLGQTDKSENKPVIDIIDRNACEIRAHILFRYPNLKEYADINALPYFPESPETIDVVGSIGPEFVASIFVNSPSGDAATINAKKIIDNRLAISANQGDFKVFQIVTEFNPKNVTIRPNSYWEEIESPENDKSKVDSMAKYLFRKYREHYQNNNLGEKDIIEGDLQYDILWDRLPEIQRARWRERADGWEVKARAVGGRIVDASEPDAKPVAVPNDDKISLVANLDRAQHRASLALRGQTGCNINNTDRGYIVKQIITKMNEDIADFRAQKTEPPVYFIKEISPA